MFIKNYTGWRLDDSPVVQQKCLNCHNTTDHFVHVHPKGIQVGLVFMKKPLAGAKQYFLACPLCGSLNKELSREQVAAMGQR